MTPNSNPLILQDGGSNTVLSLNLSGSNTGQLDLYTGGSLKVRLDGNASSYINGGSLGINTTTPSTKLQVYGSGTVDPFDVSSSSNISILRVTALGNVGIGTTTPAQTLVVVGSTTLPELLT